MNLIYKDLILDEYEVITSKRLFCTFNYKYKIDKIYKMDDLYYIDSEIDINENDSSIYFMNNTDVKINNNTLIYLLKDNTRFDNINQFIRHINEYVFYPLNIFYINNSIICIESFNTFFNISINGFSMISANRTNISILDIGNFNDLIIRELENRKEK